MLKYKKTVRENDQNGFVVLLDDGRCAYVDVESGHVEVDILISSLMVCGSFKESSGVSKEIEKEITGVLEKPRSLYISNSAKEYLEDKDFKDGIDNKLKGIY